MTNQNDLKPCPFCGAAAEEDEGRISCSDDRRSVGCPARLPYFTPEQWNRRPPAVAATGLKRYDMTMIGHYAESGFEMSEDETGEWVKLKDVEALLASHGIEVKNEG